jgi:hypothetical protein
MSDKAKVYVTRAKTNGECNVLNCHEPRVPWDQKKPWSPYCAKHIGRIVRRKRG